MTLSNFSGVVGSSHHSVSNRVWRVWLLMRTENPGLVALRLQHLASYSVQESFLSMFREVGPNPSDMEYGLKVQACVLTKSILYFYFK